MNYFILYVTSNQNVTEEYYVKGKSMNFILEQIGYYSNGLLAISKGTICTYNALSMFIREIDLLHFPYLTKKEFTKINIAKSYSFKDLT